MSKKKDLTNQKFNKLTTLSRVIVNKRYHYYCKCDCGKIIDKPINGSKLINGSTKSCGCIRKGRENLHSRLEYGESSKNAVFAYYKSNAKKKNQEFSLTKEEFFKLIDSNCSYCGSMPSTTIKKKKLFGDYTYNGIDRKDNGLGYTSENCTTCCKDCNFKKGNQNQSDFINWINKVYEYQRKGKVGYEQHD